MEIITLNSSNFQPENLVENFESAIWTERYSTPSDFEITSNDIEGMINLLPRESYLSIRESTVPMIVENHKILKSPRAIPKISVTGRAFESVLERRGSVNQLVAGAKRTNWLMAAAKESDAAYRAMRTVLGDTAVVSSGYTVLAAESPAVSPNDAIPQLTLTKPFDYQTPAWSSTVTYGAGHIVGSGTVIYQSTALAGNLNKPPAANPTFWTTLFTGQPNSWGTSNIVEIAPGNLYETVLNLIAANHHGIKSVRPAIGGTKVSIEIYNGADLTGNFVIDGRFDQIDSATYLLSEQASTNWAYVYGFDGAQTVKKTQAAEPSGLARRVVVVDNSADETAKKGDSLNSRGIIELYKHNVTALVDGEISQQVAAGYNSQYFLGDILKLVAEYGLTRNVRVAEFIRTSDATGEKAYPAFEAVDS